MDQDGAELSCPGRNRPPNWGDSTLKLTIRTASRAATDLGAAFQLGMEIDPNPKKTTREETHGGPPQSLSTSKWMISVKSYCLMFSALS